MRRLKWLVPLVVLLSLLVSSVALAAPAQSAVVQTGGGYWYTVRWGDSLSSIGRAAGVSPWSIAQANGLWNPDYIRAGQQLWIPTWTPPPPPPLRPDYRTAPAAAVATPSARRDVELQRVATPLPCLVDL